MVQSGGYVFQDNAPRGTMQNIPKAAVRYVLYDDPTLVDRALGIRSTLRHVEGDPSFVRLLPTRPFGQAILDAVQNAHTSIWVSAYYISGSSTSPIKDFYAALAEKAQQGLDVVVVSENGPGTSARVREATYNFARELEQSGIRVLFMSLPCLLIRYLIQIPPTQTQPTMHPRINIIIYPANFVPYTNFESSFRITKPYINETMI